MGIKIDINSCVLCGHCIPCCPFGLLEDVTGEIRVKEGCTNCGACVEACGSGAITLVAIKKASTADESYRGVWVFAEQWRGGIKNVTYELLTRGRALADTLKTDLSAVCFGHNVADINRLISCGADKVFLVESRELADNQEDLLTYKLIELIKEHKPEIVLAGATALGRAFIPRVAATLNTGLTADCTGLDIDLEKKAAAANTTYLWREHYGHHHLPRQAPANGHRSTPRF
jgi:electron transfer flavoprotein alpha subunit